MAQLQQQGELVQLLVAGKLLYRVGPPGAGARCVKYAQRYGAEVHAAWAAAGLAPALLGCRRLPGGWLEVEMEMLEPHDGWELLACCAGDAGALLPAVHSALLRAHGLPIDAAQRLGAHGDMRGANVYVRRGGAGAGAGGALEVRFVDFDWAGATGEVVYPPLMNPEVAWSMNACTCLPIQQEHDQQMLMSGAR
jgi:hypothetical protein